MLFRDVLAHLCCSVSYTTAVRPDRTLGVPRRGLFTGEERLNLREPGDPTALTEQLEAYGGLGRREKQLAPLLIHPLLGQVWELGVHALDQLHGGRINGPGLARQKLHGSQGTQGVFHKEPGVCGTKDTGLKVRKPAPLIHHLARLQVHGEGVDGEVTTTCRFPHTHGGVELDYEVRVTLANLVVPPGDVEVDLHTIDDQLEDAERFTDVLAGVVEKECSDLRVIKAKDLDVPVLWYPVAEQVNDRSTDQVSVASCADNSLSDLADRGGDQKSIGDL